MKNWLPVCILICMTGCGGQKGEEPPLAVVTGEVPKNLVALHEIDPGLVIDLRYATPDNFLKKAVYPQNTAYIIDTVGQRLKEVNLALQAQGLRLKVWDAYRPLWVQKEMWQILSDPRFVADPRKGSIHNRGCAVDVTLVDSQGQELEMPTPFDDFSEKTHHDYADLSEAALRNRAILRTAMEQAGFQILPTEWWHYEDPAWQDYPVLDVDPYQKPL
ncbi:MAG: D-alanyl-D-alanine dipeptidase [bacterium]|nr:D-alanyl-D-alanine dipeptidase [bacterium]